MDKKKFYQLFWEPGKFLSAFLFFAVSHGLFLNFRWPSWLIMLIMIIGSFGLNFWLYKDYVFSLIASLIIAEIFWTMLFWPFGPLTIAAVLLIVFYILSQAKNKKKITSSLILAILAIILILLTSKWSSTSLI